RHRGGGDDALGVARVGRDELVARALVVADPHGHAQRELRVELGHAGLQLLARGGAAQLEHGLVAEGAETHGAAGSSSIGRPLACSARKDSFDVFSSRRRTRYAIPATRSPTGQYVRTRRPRAASACCRSSPRPRSTWNSRSPSGRPVLRLAATAAATERR